MWPKANFDKQIASCESTGRELSFEWSHHRISSIDSKVRVTLQNSIKHSGSERVKSTGIIKYLGVIKKVFLPLVTQTTSFSNGRRTYDPLVSCRDSPPLNYRDSWLLRPFI